jgi:hypothetical protein
MRTELKSSLRGSSCSSKRRSRCLAWPRFWVVRSRFWHTTSRGMDVEVQLLAVAEWAGVLVSRRSSTSASSLGRLRRGRTQRSVAGSASRRRAEIMSGGPSAVARPFAGAGGPCAFTTAQPQTRGGDLRDGPASRDRRNGGSRACGPPVRLRWAWLPVRARSGMRARRLGRGRGGRVSGGRA